MANTVEIIVKATDEASKVLQDVETNATKSLGGVEAAAGQSAAGLALMASAAAAAVTVVVGLGVAFSKSMIDLLSYAESLDKANQSTGVSVEFWQKLIKQGNELDITFDSMRGAIERLEKNLEGSGAALRKFGIDVADYQKLTPDEAVRRFAMQLEAIQDPMEKAAVAMAATGKAGAENIAMWHAIAIGAVDAQKALGADMVAKLNDTDQALDQAKTSVKNLIEQLTATVVMTVPFEGFFNIMTMGFRGLGDMLNAWPGIWEAMHKGAFQTAADMFQAAVAAGTHEKATQKTSTAVLEMTETTRKLTKGLDEYVAILIKEGKEEDKNTKAKEARQKKLDALAKKFEQNEEAMRKASMATETAQVKSWNALDVAAAAHTRYMETQEAKQIAAADKAWKEMARAALAYYDGIDFAASANFFKTTTQLQQTAIAAKAAYDEMLRSGTATYKELQDAHAAYKQAEADLNAKSSVSAIQGFELIASSASSILRSLFGKSKAAAIAAAIIDTLAAIVKTMASYPWPWSLIPAAAAAAAGYATVQKIRNQDAGFAQGTPGTSFIDFREGTPAMLHGQEAVVTRPQAEGVASMVRDAIKEGLRGGRGAASPARIDVHVHLDGREIASSVGRRFQAGLVPALAR